MSNSYDPDQAQHFVGPDLGPNCMQKLLADDKKVKKDVNKLSVGANNIYVELSFLVKLSNTVADI